MLPKAASLFAYADTVDFEKVYGVFSVQIQKGGAAGLYFTSGKDAEAGQGEKAQHQKGFRNGVSQ